MQSLITLSLQIKLQGVSNPGVVEKELEYKHSTSPVDEEDDYDVPVNLVFNKRT